MQRLLIHGVNSFLLIVILIGGTVDDLSKISHWGIPMFFELVERESLDGLSKRDLETNVFVSPLQAPST